MELTTSSLCALAAFTFLISRYLLSSLTRRKIPGPSFLTVLFNFHLFGTVNFHKLLAEWTKRYGKIYSFNLFGKRFIVVGCPDMMKTIFSVEERTKNVPFTPFELYSQGHYGIGTSKKRVEQRKFAVQKLKEYGFRGAGATNDELTKDLDDMILSLAEKGKNPVDAESLQLPTLNVMWRITASTNFSADNLPLLRRFQKYFVTLLFSKKQNFLGPLLASVGLESEVTRKYKETIVEFHKIQQDIIDEHAKKLDGGSEPGDYIDAFLLRIRDAKFRGSSFDGEVGIKNLRAALMDMNVAGSNTVAHVFQSIIFYLALYPEVQSKLREHLDSVLGSTRNPVLQDRKSLPYFEAFILEVLRVFSPVPITFRESSEGSKFEGYVIPKGTTIIGNVWGSNHNEKVWEDPMSFKPERFWDSSVEKIQKSELVMSFGAGRRKCPGYLIGQDILFLLTVRIVQRFIIQQHPNHPITSLEPILTFFLAVPDFKVLFTDRLSTAGTV